MLFRDKKGNIIELCKNNYINDVEYYKAIMKIKGFISSAKGNNELERIMNLVKKR